MSKPTKHSKTTPPLVTGTQTEVEYRREIEDACYRLIGVAQVNDLDVAYPYQIAEIAFGLIELRRRGRGWHTVEWERPMLHYHAPEGLTPESADLLIEMIRKALAKCRAYGYDATVWDGDTLTEGGMLSGDHPIVWTPRKSQA